MRQSQQAQFLDERNEAEMDFSDTEGDDKDLLPKKKRKTSSLDGVGECADISVICFQYM